MKILISESHLYSQKALSILSSFGRIEQCTDLTRKLLIEKISKTDILVVRLAHHIDRGVIDAADNLKLVASPTTGLNHIDLEYLNQKKIPLISLKGEYDFLKTITATAELTWGLLLNLTREIPNYINDCKLGLWNREAYPGIDLSGKTLGLIGLGRLGTIVAEYASAFRMKVIAYDPHKADFPKFVESVTLDNLLKSADIISLHVNYTNETHHLLSFQEFKKMERKPILLNTSRGDVIHEEALLDALNKNLISKAALDVLSNEHLQNPDWLKINPVYKYFLGNKRLILAPHIGGASIDSMRKTEDFLAEKILQWFKKNA